MKNIQIISYIILILWVALIFVSCQKTASVDDEREYRSGYQYGEKIAKQDTIDFGCTGTIDNPSSNVTVQQEKYLGKLKKTKSDKYIKGFLWGYQSSFKDYLDLHCRGSR